MVSSRWKAFFVFFISFFGTSCAINSELIIFSNPSVSAIEDVDSFWKERVQYPLHVEYFHAKDRLGKDWEIAVADSHGGLKKQSNIPILVLVHGRGANLGYFSQLIEASVANGIRVIAFDLPGYGKSLPGNLQNDIPRSLEDTRELVYDVLVKQKNIGRATYLGHSMGGQWVIGYALKYPESVEKIILESSYGLEEYGAYLALDESQLIPAFDPAYLNDYSQWQRAWKPLGLLEQEFEKTPEDIENTYKLKVDPESGAPVGGYFYQTSRDGDFLTKTRIEMTLSHFEEYKRYVKTSVWDIYCQGVEVLRNNPKSLFKRLREINVPVFLAFGELDPYLPNSLFSGNRDLKGELIRGVYNQLLSTGREPAIIMYPESGHVPHADAAENFASDVIEFVQTGKLGDLRPSPVSFKTHRSETSSSKTRSTMSVYNGW